MYYGYKTDKRVIIGDVHEDGRYLYPGTGFAYETGEGNAKGTKLNIPLSPGSGDLDFFQAFDQIEAFVRKFRTGIYLSAVRSRRPKIRSDYSPGILRRRRIFTRTINCTHSRTKSAKDEF